MGTDEPNQIGPNQVGPEANAAPKPDLKARAHQSARLLWAGLVVMATLGGVLGLYQFVFDRADDPADTRAIIASMIQSGKLDASKADDLLALIDDTDGGGEALASAFDEGSTKQIEALALIAVPSTEEQGLAMLEAEADSAEDWYQLGQFAYNRDADLAVEALRMAVALDPGNIRYMTVLAQMQIHDGDFAAARRSSATVDALMRSDEEKLMAANLAATLVLVKRDKTEYPGAIDRLQKALMTYTDLDSFVLPDGVVTSGKAEREPFWIASYSAQMLATLATYKEDHNMALEEAARGVRYISALMPSLSGRALQSAQRREASLHDSRANSMHKLDRIETHHEAHEKAIALLKLVGEDDLATLQRVPHRLHRLAVEYAWLDEDEKALLTMDEAITLQEDIVRKIPGEWQHEWTLMSMNAQRARLAGDYAKSEEIITKLFELAEADMRRNGLDEEKASWVMGNVAAIAQETELLKLERDTILPHNQQVVDFLNATERRYGSSLTLTQLRLSALLSLAFDHEKIGNKAAAREIYEEVVVAAEDLPEDSEYKAGYQLYPLMRLAENSDDGARYAERGLELAEALDAKDALPSNYQSAIPQFRKILDEADADSIPN